MYLLPSCSAWIRAINVTTGFPAVAPSLTRGFKTSLFEHYGPDHDVRVGGLAVVVDAKDLCGNSLSSEIKMMVLGRIVVSEATYGICRLEVKYKRLFEAGALALVNMVPIDPPGLLCFRRHDWITDEFKGASLVLVSASIDRGSWSTLRNENGLALAIEPPHDTSYANAFTSVEWLLSVRIFAPFWAIYASFIAFKEAFILLKTNSTHKHPSGISVVFVVCAVEAPILLVVAVVLACGQHGPMVLPVQVHLACLNLFSGISLTTSVLISLYLTEECRPAPQRRVVWVHYKWMIRVCALVNFIA